MATRRTVTGDLVMAGTSTFPLRYHWQASPFDQIQLDASLGNDKSFASLSSVRQLSQHDLGQVSVTLSGEGAGMQLVSRRTLGERTTASLTWVIGPVSQQGMSAHVVQRFDNASLTGKLEVRAPARRCLCIPKFM